MRLRQRVIRFSLAVIFLSLGLPVEAQQAVKIPRIGFLEDSSASTIAVRLEAFRQELRRLGWIEEKNITIENRFAEHKPERVPALGSPHASRLDSAGAYLTCMVTHQGRGGPDPTRSAENGCEKLAGVPRSA